MDVGHRFILRKKKTRSKTPYIFQYPISNADNASYGCGSIKR